MRPPVDPAKRHQPDPPTLRILRVLIAVLSAAVLVVGGYVVFLVVREPTQVQAAVPAVIPTTESSTTTSSTTTTTPPRTTTPPPVDAAPPYGPRTVIPASEAEPAAKQLAVDIAYTLTNYDATDDQRSRLTDLASRTGDESLLEASAPLTHPGKWSRGEVVYPQMGGLNDERASVMVVTRQTVGSGADAEFSVLRTLDIRLVRAGTGWEFDFLSSAGGTFDETGDLATAHAVANDPRIILPDSARLDILSGLVSPDLLDVMAKLADQTSFEVVTFSTGHPHHVFDTDRVSHHTVGQAVDINRIGDRLVIDDRDPGSTTRAIAQWLYDNPDVHQVGSPWDLDGSDSRRSFTDAVHQDHIHLAVVDN